MVKSSEREAKKKELEAQLAAILAEEEAEKAAEEAADLKTVLDLIAKHSFTAERLGFKAAAPTQQAAAAVSSDDKRSLPKPVYYNVQAKDGEKICRGVGKTLPDWYKNATKEAKEVFKVTDHKKAHELLLQYGKAKDAANYYARFLSASQSNLV